MSNEFAALLGTIRREGAAYNAPGVELATIKSTSPLVLYIGGTEISADIYAPPWLLTDYTVPALPAEQSSLQAFLEAFFDNLKIVSGDLVAVKRAGEINIILGKVVSADDIS